MKETMDPDWRKARIAARILMRAREPGRVGERDRRLARQLTSDPGVTERLIHQALACHTGARRRHVSP